MASKAEVTPQKEEVSEKEGPETPPGSPLLDLSDAAIKKLIHSAKKRGYDQEISLDEYGRAASHLRRILETLGLKREPRDATTIDGEVEVFTSPMRTRWALEEAAAAAAAAKEATE